jgi:tetratricopeptide (TPR) repeat protein
MHLDLGFPTSSAWVVKQAPNEQYAAILPGPPGKPPDAIITYGPIMVVADEPRRWMEQTARSECPKGARVNLGNTAELQTTTGWPLRLLEAEVVTGDGQLVEVRACAFFSFFEHASAAIVRTADRAHLEAHREAILEILKTGRPDWSGEPTCVAEVWDLAPGPDSSAPSSRTRDARIRNKSALEVALAEVDAALADTATAELHTRRAALLLDLDAPDRDAPDLDRSAEALAATDAAIAVDSAYEPAHRLRGEILGALGRHADALSAWQRALELAPDRADTVYNIAQAQFLTRDFAGALVGFQRVSELDPDDVMVLRKVTQCLYALGRDDEGQATRVLLRDRWSRSTDPRVQMITEVVFDQFEGDGFWVHAIETLRPRNPAFYPVLTFRAVDLHAGHDQPLPASVLVETSDQARAAGTPFVFGVLMRGQYRGIGSAKQLPPYLDLKRDVVKLLREALAVTPRS